MSLIVQKFGGTSVGDAERIRNVARRVVASQRAGHKVAVIVSAMAGETNALVALAKELGGDAPDPREYDALISIGESKTIALLAMAIQRLGGRARSFTGAQMGMLTDTAHTRARIQSIATERIRQVLDEGGVAVLAGFQGIDEDGNVTTLGRGGSDTSAVAVAAALAADVCEIYTDVDGVYTSDPNLVPAARKLERVSFEEMLEMASLGSKVLQIRAVEFAGKYRVRLRVLSSFEEEGDGTLITFEEDEKMEQAIISGIAFNRDEAKITVMSVPDRPGIAYAILGPIADANIDVDMIIQNASVDGITDFSFTVHRNDYQKALGIAKKVQAHIGAKGVVGDNRVCKVSMVGVGMRSHVGIASQMFRTLAEEGINIEMISTSEIKISVVVDEKYLELAVRVLHKAFGLDQPA